MSKLDEVRASMLTLPQADRARLAREILASLDPPGAEDDNEAWIAEIERRSDDVASGRAQLSSWPEVRKRIDDRYK